MLTVGTAALSHEFFSSVCVYFRIKKIHVHLHMSMEKFLLYAEPVTPRLRYIASHVVSGILGGELLFTGNLNEARSANIPLINYSGSPVPGAVNIIPHDLLGERIIQSQHTDPVNRDGIPLIFPSSGPDDTGFDLFAASFFMLSRYEEYLPYKKDSHGRFPYVESMACRHSLEDEPLVDLWAMILKKTIIRKYPSVSFPEREFSFIPTIDVDIPWAYRNRGFLRTAGGIARSLLRADIEDVRLRYRVLLRGDPDPYDTFDLIEKIHKDYGVSPVFFFSAGTYGMYDKCISSGNPDYRRLITGISERNDWGIHPSYLSFDDPVLLRKEMEIIAGITGEAPVRSRQHYLRLRFPHTCRILAANGISDDYTVGWAEMPGFRAGTCTPFFFYDLEREEPSELKLIPFQIMDGTLRDYLELSPEAAADHALMIVKKVRDVRGTLVTLWHNESFSDLGRWNNWKNVYLEIIKEATR